MTESTTNNMSRYKFDCRHADGGKRCRHLRPWRGNQSRIQSHIYTCLKLRVNLFPALNEKGKIGEELLGVPCDRNCPYVIKVSNTGEIPFFDFRINPDGTTEHWNPITYKQ